MSKKIKENGQWPKGTSGNPAGRPPGSRNASTVLAEQLLEGEAEGLVRTAIELAKKGNPAALRICLERLVPIRRDRTVAFEMPPVQSPQDLAAAYQSITTAVCEGRITPAEAQSLSEVLANHARVLEMGDLTRRIEALESFKQAVEQYRHELSKIPERFANEFEGPR